MAKPPTRTPRQASLEPALEPAPDLSPAPNNGVHLAATSAPKSPAIIRRGRQLATRIPEELADRLDACAEGTSIPKGRLIARALDAELKSHGY